MAKRTENREEIIVEMLQLKVNNNDLTEVEIQTGIKKLFGQEVSRSFVNQNLQKYKECKSITDIKQQDLEQKENPKPKTNNSKPKKKSTAKKDNTPPEIIEISNNIIGTMINQSLEIVSKNLRIRPDKNGTINLIDAIETASKVSEYIKAKLESLIVPLKQPTKPKEELPQKLCHYNTPEIRRKIQNRVSNGEDVQTIADDHGVSLEELKEVIFEITEGKPEVKE